MREPTSPSRPDLLHLALGLVPAALVTVVMALVLAVLPYVDVAGKRTLYEAAVLANLAVWFAFAPPYLVGWVQLWDPSLRARTGVLGTFALAGVLWFANLFMYAGTGSVLGGLLR